jgi:Pyruvate/2-oxoglutarate dehydrogenase complex, dihydrolipoamide acyltransferase (E2) component, and related enzymes
MPAFLLPDLGEGLTEAEIVTWHVQTGDTVTVDQPIVEVETAKAVVEVPVPFAGRVTALHGQPGDCSGRRRAPAHRGYRRERQRPRRLRHLQRAPSPSPGHAVFGRQQRSAAQRPVARCLAADQAARPQRRP